MSVVQILIIAITSAVLTIPAVLFVPRARQSPAFDLFLWAATWVIGFLGGWAALGYATSPGSAFPLESYRVGDVPILTVLVGVAAGIVFLHVVLWAMDRLAHPASELDDLEEPDLRETPPTDESQNPLT